MLRCAMVGWLGVEVASCGSAPPSDLLLPHAVSVGEMDAGAGSEMSEASAPDVTVQVPEDAGSKDVSAPMEASGCSPDNCSNGCCDVNGQCRQGTDDSSCGSGGMACTNCMDLGEMCMAGMCVMPPQEAGCDPMACPKCTFFRMPCCNMMGACSCASGFTCP
jgi:hypothetical protein